jgi:GNAT superfamily N-acetyltransferase
MLTEQEIISSLTPLNGTYFLIEDIGAYASYWQSHGKVLCRRENDLLVSYILYCDDGPEAFISMVWTDPQKQRRGYARQLLQELRETISKQIRLEVDPRNPARDLLLSLGFEATGVVAACEQMRLGRRIAIMQPYFYPYIGYFNLIESADLIVFYDDVNFIKRGRIHRNSILVNGSEYQFTVPISKASQNRLIMDTALHDFDLWRSRFLKQLEYSYRRAPYFNAVMKQVQQTLHERIATIADLAIASICGVYAYLGVNLRYTRSSQISPETQGLEKSQRLIEITKKAKGTRYINTIGGTKLYEKSHFAAHGIELSFVKVNPVNYRQYGETFIPWLSIIDVLMFNPPAQVREMFRCYTVV